MSKHADHRSHLSRVNRIEGQVRGVKNMIEEGKYCVDILTQIKAIRSALKGLELQILEAQLGHRIYLRKILQKNRNNYYH